MEPMMAVSMVDMMAAETAVLKVDLMVAWTVASRVESWAENWAASKADYLAVSKVALKAVPTVDYLAA